MVTGAPAEPSWFAHPESHSGSRGIWLSALFLISIVLALGFLERNNFPAMWHPDEQDKVKQMLTGERYFSHPLLLLRSTELLLATTRHPSPEQVVTAGRQVSAISAVLSIIMLALAAARLYGYQASLFVAVIVGSCPLLFGLAHYMKEDCIFVFGLCLFFLTVVLFEEKANTLRFLGMSISAGLAASAKYPGLITLPIGIGMLLWKWRCERTPILMGLVVFFCGALITFFTIGVPVISFNQFRLGLGDEIKHVTTSHLDFVWPISSQLYLLNLLKLSSPIIVASYILWLFILYLNRLRVSAAQTIIALFPMVFLIILQMLPVKIIRYELPTVMLVGFGGTCALANLARAANSRTRLLARTAFVGALIFNTAMIYRSWQSIAYDTRAEMAHWIEEHLPRDAVIAQEARAIEGGQRSINPDSGLVSARVATKWFESGGLASYGSVDGVRQAGVTHILLQQEVYGCHVDPEAAVRDDPEARSRVSEARRFYESLIRETPVVHYVEGSNPPGTFFSPALWLFCIICDPASATRQKIDYRSSCLT
jgi:hypothetical protein